MKKLIAVLTLFFAFAFNANAQQDKNAIAEDAAKQDAIKLSETVGLQGTQQADLTRLFVMKEKTMNEPSVSDEKKAEMSKIVGAKLRATLTPDQFQKLNANPELLAKLTGAAPAKKDASKK